MLGTICTQILDQLESSERTQGRPLTIVETGTAYPFDIKKGSTFLIAEWVAQQTRKVNFYSIDHSEAQQDACVQALRQLGHENCVQFICGDSIAMLDSVPESFFDFVLLDAGSGHDTLDEYKIVAPKVRQPGVVVVADAFKDRDSNKAQLVMPLAYQQRHSLTEFYRQAVAVSFDADEIVRAARAY